MPADWHTAATDFNANQPGVRIVITSGGNGHHVREPTKPTNRPAPAAQGARRRHLLLMASFQPTPMTIWDAGGDLQELALPGPGGQSAWSSVSLASSRVWRIWPPSNKFDVYVGIRAILGYEKWSLHETGDWRCQFINDEKAAEFGDGGNRIIDQWERPAEIGETGLTRGLAIRVRHQDLVEVATP
jgi:hypothetical protein